VWSDEEISLSQAISKLQKVFGIVSASVVSEVDSNFDSICVEAQKQVEKLSQEGKKKFKVESRRGDKKLYI
jgi:adenylyl- and sulfurtransferase ThiI